MANAKLRTLCKLAIVFSVLCTTLSASPMAVQDKAADEGGAWGKAVDGLVCRLTVQPRYTVGQLITVVVEIKNVSDKKRYIVRRLGVGDPNEAGLTIIGPRGKMAQPGLGGNEVLNATSFEPIEPGQVKRVELKDLGDMFPGLAAWTTMPERKTNAVATGKYNLQFRFASPKIPPVYKIANSDQSIKASAEMLAGEWVGEIEAAPVSFELLPLGREDLVVHEWGVFTVLNDSKYANADHKEEWASLPTFFYRQFPIARLPYFPSIVTKPIIYVYAKPNSMRVNFKLTFQEGTPVVWWPAASDPVSDPPAERLGINVSNNKQPYRWLIWEAWVGDLAPIIQERRNLISSAPTPWGKVADFPLPPGSWLQLARLPEASRLSVIGTVEHPEPRRQELNVRTETERFLYYDGFVPAPDYLHCEKANEKTVTLRNGAPFDFGGLFVIDRRVKGRTQFASLGGVQQPFKAGATLDVKLQPITAADWPAAGVKEVRQALLDAGLFAWEADSVLKIWQKRLLESDGLVAFHILPQSEYDRKLPLDVLPAPVAKPVRVGIAFHPNLEIEPALRQRVAKLVKELDSESYAKRAAASKELLEIGPVAIGALRAELNKQPSLEARRRIEAVIDSVDGTEWMKSSQTEKKKGP